ncbi:amidohydrolase family protein [Phyllobacterium sp. 22552]|uniref:amidohydrolase family protein n=1 Tax=Phyllobacterium sp. 22552 TaxID=3453941 RepID=UPI003F86B7B5
MQLVCSIFDHLAEPPVAYASTDADAWLAVEDFNTYSWLALEKFEPDRIIFGSDCPDCTLAASYSTVKAIAQRQAETNPRIAERFYHLNAIAAYRLSGQKTGIH